MSNRNTTKSKSPRKPSSSTKYAKIRPTSAGSKTCSDRIIQLALPNLHIVSSVLKDHFKTLKKSQIDRLEKLIDQIKTCKESLSQINFMETFKDFKDSDKRKIMEILHKAHKRKTEPNVSCVESGQSEWKKINFLPVKSSSDSYLIGLDKKQTYNSFFRSDKSSTDSSTNLGTYKGVFKKAVESRNWNYRETVYIKLEGIRNHTSNYDAKKRQQNYEQNYKSNHIQNFTRMCKQRYELSDIQNSVPNYRPIQESGITQNSEQKCRENYELSDIQKSTQNYRLIQEPAEVRNSVKKYRQNYKPIGIQNYRSVYETSYIQNYTQNYKPIHELKNSAPNHIHQNSKIVQTDGIKPISGDIKNMQEVNRDIEVLYVQTKKKPKLRQLHTLLENNEFLKNNLDHKYHKIKYDKSTQATDIQFTAYGDVQVTIQYIYILFDMIMKYLQFLFTAVSTFLGIVYGELGIFSEYLKYLFVVCFNILYNSKDKILLFTIYLLGFISKNGQKSVSYIIVDEVKPSRNRNYLYTEGYQIHNVPSIVN